MLQLTICSTVLCSLSFPTGSFLARLLMRVCFTFNMTLVGWLIRFYCSVILTKDCVHSFLFLHTEQWELCSFIPTLREQLNWNVVHSRWFFSSQTAYSSFDTFHKTGRYASYLVLVGLFWRMLKSVFSWELYSPSVAFCEEAVFTVFDDWGLVFTCSRDVPKSW